jgi:hypothetical protein
MRGKKSKVLGCGCCVAEDHREEILWKEASNEVQYVMSGQDERDSWNEILLRELMRTEAEEMAAFSTDIQVDEFTIAKYTWGQGMSDPRIRAVLAQQHADFLKRVADSWDALLADAA